MSGNEIQRDLIVIGASAGGYMPLCELLAQLPSSLKAAICVVIHTAPDSPGAYAELLQAHSPMKVNAARDALPLVPGHVYIAPPDRHLLVKEGFLSVNRGPKENRFRPAIDPLFRSAAKAYGSRVIGIILSGGLNDGTNGAMVVKSRGGLIVVQDPEEAVFPEMPASVIAHVQVDHVLRISEMAHLIVRRCQEVVLEIQQNDANEQIEEPNGKKSCIPKGEPVPIVCPECGGPLWEHSSGNFMQFRCHTGHAFSGESLLSGQSDELESALWAAVRILDENHVLLKKMADKSKEKNQMQSVLLFQERAEESARRAHVIRKMLLSSKVKF